METNFKTLEVERVIELGDAELDIVSGGGAFVPPGKCFHDGGWGRRRCDEGPRDPALVLTAGTSSPPRLGLARDGRPKRSRHSALTRPN